MPPLPVPGDILKVDCNLALFSGLSALSRYFIAYSGGAPDAAELVTFTAALNTAWNANLKALCSSEVYLVSHEATDLSSDTGASGLTPDSIQGTRAGEALPADASALVSFEIARRYRGGHPRGYWPFGVGADLLSTNTWESASVTAFLDGLSGYFAAVVAAGWSGAGTLSQVNISYHQGFTVVISPTTGRARNIPKVRTTPVVDTITALLVRSTVASQRRRLHERD